MTDTPTYSDALYAPEVWADIAQATFAGAVKVGPSGAVVEDNGLVGVPGEDVIMPKWDSLTDMADGVENVDVEAEEMGQAHRKATIKEAVKAVTISDRAKLVGFGNVQDEAIRQFGILAARKIDADLITAAQATLTLTKPDNSTSSSQPLKATIGSLSYANLTGAITDPSNGFADDFEPDDYAGLFIRSEDQNTILNDDNFLNAQKVLGNGGVVVRGQIGTYFGLPVLVTNRLAVGKALILKRNSLGLFYKQRPIIEFERHAKGRKTDVVQSMHYAVGRADDKGVLVLTIGGGGTSSSSSS